MMEMTKETLSGLRHEDFRSEFDGCSTRLYVLRNETGMEVCLTNLGGIVLSVMVPDRDGNMDNVVLGADSLEMARILARDWYIGALIGPVAGRILDGKFRVKGKDFALPLNSVPNTLHSGAAGFHTVIWEAEQSAENSVCLSYRYKDGEAGFPGNMDISVMFTVTDDNALRIDYHATADSPTLFCPTHHGYFNLDGIKKPMSSIENHQIEIDSDFYLPTDVNTNHTGEILRVEGTPFDFRKMRTIGERIGENHIQLQYGKGYDHVFVLRKREHKELTHAARLKSLHTGRVMDVITSEIGIVMYTGNYLDGVVGMDDAVYTHRCALCLETQCFPDAPNNLHFPSVELLPGNVYSQTCIYKFSTEP